MSDARDMNGRPKHIEAFLASYKNGQWFDWSDIYNKVYKNIVSLDGTAIPSEADCIAGLKAMQDAWDLENDSYKSKRRKEYPSIANQLDDLYHNGIDGWKATIKSVKDKYPKGYQHDKSIRYSKINRSRCYHK